MSPPLLSRFRRSLFSRKRESSAAPAFAPSDLPNLFAWYDANTDTVVADDTILTGWTDRSSNGRNMIDGVAVNANFKGPRYKTSIFGSKPALKGWGSNGAARSFLRYNATFPDSATVYMVIQTDSSTAAQVGIMGTSASGNDPSFTGPYFLLQDNNGTARTLDNVTFRDVLALSRSTKYIIRIEWERVGDTQKVYVNGSLSLNSIIADSGSRAWYEIFSGYQGVFQGYIAEVAISSVVDNGSNQTKMETYLKDKWGVY